ncbi:MAG: histidine--tRNA ligase [Candidatus Aenigmatarchaeota archaeon]
MDFEKVRGTRDFLPREMNKRKYVFSIIRDIFEKYGFDPLESSALEKFKTLARKSGEEVAGEIYKFEDKGGREIGLRFDLTVPLGRIMANNQDLAKPFKRYCIGRVWRYERPRKGRYREFWQADIDTVGVESTEADVECVKAGIEAFRELGLKDFIIRLSNRKLSEGLIRKAGVDEDKVEETFRAIDKLEKIGKEGVTEELEERGIDEEKIPKILELLEISGKNEEVLEKTEELLENIEIGQEGIEEVREFLKIAKKYGFGDEVKVDLSLVRGMGYYTGNIFEVALKNKDYPSLGGGGRYDDLVEIYGGDEEPAVGFSIGVEPLIDVLTEEGKLEGKKTETEVYILPVNEDVRSESIGIANKLRRKLIKTELSLKDRSISSQLSYCNKKEIPIVIIVGERDLEKDSVTVKEMESGDENLTRLENLVEEVEKLIDMAGVV